MQRSTRASTADAHEVRSVGAETDAGGPGSGEHDRPMWAACNRPRGFGVFGCMAISAEMESLLEKLEALELTEGERAAFGQLLGVAQQSDDVEGFAGIAGIRVQGFNLIDTFPTSIGTRPGRTGQGVVDHKADD